MLGKGSSDGFRVPKKKSECHKLKLNGTTITGTAELLDTWVTHFNTLAQSQADHHPQISQLESELPLLEAHSHVNEGHVFDTAITLAEIKAAVTSLKTNKRRGANNLDPEHLKLGGDIICYWLLKVFSAIIRLETIPNSLKIGVITPIFNGRGRSPLDPNNYRGITLTLVIVKYLERLMLNRMSVPLEDSGFPHMSQSAYQQGISCANAIFANQEVLLRFAKEGAHPYLCLYDLEKAFDTIEHATLLTHLYKRGVNGKCWRLIKSWY